MSKCWPRDRGRLADARARVNENALGAAALAGTSYPIDRNMTSKDLASPVPCAILWMPCPARDYILEVLAACTISSIHLSRFGRGNRDLVFLAVSFRELSDKFTTGSSIMPQKRNPDAAELIRAKPGRILGAFTALAMCDEGSAHGLCQGHAGRQGTDI